MDPGEAMGVHIPDSEIQNIIPIRQSEADVQKQNLNSLKMQLQSNNKQGVLKLKIKKGNQATLNADAIQN